MVMATGELLDEIVADVFQRWTSPVPAGSERFRSSYACGCDSIVCCCSGCCATVMDPAEPFSPRLDDIAWTRPTTVVWAGSVCPAITASTMALFLMVYDSRSPLVFLSKRFWDESSAIGPTPAYIQSVPIVPRSAVPTTLSSLML